MIRVVNLDDNSEKTINVEAIPSIGLRNVWFELLDPTTKELETIADITQVPKTFLELPETDGGSVNLRLEDGLGIINFVVLQDVLTKTGVQPIVMVFARNYLVTVSTKEAQNLIKVAKERMSKTKIDPPSQVTYFIIDEIVSSHFTQLEHLEELSAHLEEEVLEKTDSETLKKIFTLKSRLISLNKTLWYERGLIFNLRKCGDACMEPKARNLFDTTHEDLTRQIDIVETYREIMSDAINVHLSAVSNKTHFAIKSLTVIIFYLTIITTVTSFPNTVATFFGISQFGNTSSIIVLVAILLSIVLPFLWLWKKRWLRYEQKDYQ